MEMKTRCRKRTLWDCFNAKVKGTIYCKKGYTLDSLPVSLMQKGDDLYFEICQHCDDFEGFEEYYLRKSQRGWSNKG